MTKGGTETTVSGSDVDTALITDAAETAVSTGGTKT